MRMLVALQAEKNRQVMQSIDYASVIQRAMLSASRTAMSQALSDACLIWEPRDVVGGDFITSNVLMMAGLPPSPTVPDMAYRELS